MVEPPRAMNKPFNPLPEHITAIHEDPFAYYAPIVSIGHLIVPIGTDLDNKAIAKAVIDMEDARRSEDAGDTKVEDSLLPYDNPHIQGLLERIDGFARKLNPHFEPLDVAESWGHVLNPGQNTDYHTHIRDGWPDGISWVYYPQYPQDSGSLFFVVDAAARRTMVEVNPQVGNLVIFPSYAPHYTRRNMSEEKRVSISGNYFPDPNKVEKYDHFAMNEVTPLAHVLGIWQG